MTKKAWISFFILLGLDSALRFFFHPITQITPVSAAIALAFSLFFWSFVDYTLRLLPSSIKNLFSASVALFWVILLATQIPSYMRFGEYASPFMLNWVIQDPQYVLDYSWSLATVPNALAFLFAWSLFYFIWSPRKHHQKTFALKLVSLWFVSLLLSVVMLNQIRRETLGQLKLADGALAFSLDTIARKSGSQGYHFSKRMSLNSVQPVRKLPNVFIFIGESWSKPMVPNYGWSKSETMPFLRKFTKEESVVVFNSAFTNSGATDVSLPSLLSGVGPEESSDKLHQMPLMWDWARNMGYETIFISPQRLAFNGIHNFFLSPGPDLFIPGDAIDFKMVNDSGIDDLKAVDFLDKKLDSRQTPNKPLFIIFFHNALHFPFLTESPGLEIPAFATRYEKALFITDKAIERIVTSLQKRNLWNDTLFWLTADHGEVETSTSRMPRIASFYEEILGIPFMIRWPKTFSTPLNTIQTPNKLDKNLKIDSKSATESISANCFNGFIKNQNVNVQNLDILPTLVEVWNAQISNTNVYQELHGSSLCKAIDNNRTIVHLNTNQIRHWNPEGFAITIGAKRFSFTNIEGGRLFDLTFDKVSAERTPAQESIQTERFIKIIDSKPLLKELWDRYPKKN